MFTDKELEFLLELHKEKEGVWKEIHKAMKEKFRKKYTLVQLQNRFYKRSTSENALYWTKEEKKFVAVQKTAGKTFAEIAFLFHRKFKKKKSESAFRNQLKALEAAGEYTPPKEGAEFNRANLSDIKKEVNSKQKKIFVIAAVSPMTDEDGANFHEREEDAWKYLEPNLHRPTFDSMKNYLKRNKAELVLLPMRAHVKALHTQPFVYDKELFPYKKNFVTDMTINGVLKIIEAHLNPQQINPLTGFANLKGKTNKYIFQDLDEEGRIRDVFDKNRTSSIIVAHSKQMMDTYPTGMESTPRIIHSTGSLTCPQYIENRMGRIASEAHTLGFVIVEVHGNTFWIRQVQSDPNTGEFVSMGVRYFPDGKAKRERADTISFGDLHMGAHDEQSLDCAFDMIRYFKPKHAVWHDIHDAKSYTHHDQKNMVTFLRNPEHFNSLEAEGKMNREILDDIYNVQEEVGCEGHIVDSNHNDHLNRYLEERRFNNDRINYKLAVDLQSCFLRGLDPLRCLIDSGCEDPLEVIFKGYKSKFTWHEKNTDFIRWGVQLGQHGHQGTGGSRGSPNQHSMAYTNAIVGHTHKPSIVNGVYTNGTLSLLRLDYNNGPMNWLHAHTILYDKGMREMIVEIKGQWKIENAPYDKIK